MFYTSILLYSTVHVFFFIDVDVFEKNGTVQKRCQRDWSFLPSGHSVMTRGVCVCERSQGWFGNGAGTR